MIFKIFLIWLFVLVGRPQDFLPFLAPFRLALLLTMANIFLLPFTLEGKLSDILKEKAVKRYLMFFAAMAIGIPFAYHRRFAFNFTFLIYLVNILFFVVFVIRVNSHEKLRKVFFLLCVSLLFYSSFAMLQGQITYGRLAFGSMFDPNDLAYFFVSLIPFCIFFILIDQGRLKKYLSISAMFVGLSVTLLTGSRGGIIGLSAVTVSVLLSKGDIVKKKHKMMMVALICISAVTYASQINLDRLFTITDLGSDYNVTDETGRLGIWERGLEMFYQNPITGVGADCFPIAIGHLRAQSGDIPKWQVAHSSYIQILSETGLIGFGLFLSCIIQCFRILRQKREKQGLDEERNLQMKLMTSCTKWGFIGHLICAFFLTQGYSILFSLFFAISASIAFIKKRESESAITAEGEEKPA